MPKNFAGERSERGIVQSRVGKKMRSKIQLSRTCLWVRIVLIEIALVTPGFSQSVDNGQGTARAPDSFVFTTENLRQYSQVSLGNGYLVGATPWNGAAPTSSTVVGLYDHLEEKAYIYQALIPSWNEVYYWNGSHSLNQFALAQFRAVNNRQSLNTYHVPLQMQYDAFDCEK